MHSPGINGEGELRGQPTNPGSPGKMAVKTECMCVMMEEVVVTTGAISRAKLQSYPHHQHINTLSSTL